MAKQQQQQKAEFENRVIYLNGAIFQAQEQLRTLQQLYKQKDQASIKLREDNQHMFQDLKQLAMHEEALKHELQETQFEKHQLELHIQAMQEGFKAQLQQVHDQM